MSTAEKQVFEAGRKHGEQFSGLTKGAVSRLRELFDRTVNEPVYDWDFWFLAEGSAYTPGERLYFVMFPKGDGDRAAAGMFWESVGESDPLDSDYVKGFGEGALGLDQR